MSHDDRSDDARLTVSVIIPCYNSEATLPWVLQSVAAQTLKPAEVILVDDGSEHDPAPIAEAYREMLSPTKLIVIRQANRGVAAARNAGIARATSSLLAFVDGDDCWMPEKLAIQVPEFENPATVLCGTDFYVVKSLATPRQHLSHVACSAVQGRAGHGIMGLYRKNYIATSTAMVRADTVARCGGFDEKLRVMEDYDLWQRVARHGRVVIVSQPLMEYLDRPGSLSKKSMAMWQAGLRLAWRHRPNPAAVLPQALMVTLQMVKNRLARGPMVGGRPIPAHTQQL